MITLDKLSSSLRFIAAPRILAGTAISLAFVQAVFPILAGGHNAQRLAQLTLLAVLGIWILAGGWIDAVAGSTRHWRWKPICAAFLLGGMSASLASSPQQAFMELAILLMLLALAARIAHEFEQSPDESLVAVLSALGLGCFVYMVAVISAYAAALAFELPMSLHEFAPGFDNRRFLNHAQTIGLPLLGLLVVLAAPERRLSKLWFATAACWWTLLFATAGRGTFLGIAVGCALACAVMGPSGRRFCKVMLSLALAGLAIYVVALVLIPLAMGMEPFGLLGGVGERSLSRPTSGRIELWAKAVELIGSHPFLGAGPAHYAQYALSGSLPAHPHNWLLQFGAEWGIPAALLLMWVAGRGVRALVKAGVALEPADCARRDVLSAFIVAAVAILVDALVSGLVVMPLSQLLIALFLGIATGWLAPQEKKRGVVPMRAPIRGLLRLVLACAVLIIGWGAASYFKIAAGIEKEPVRSYYNPRIWNDGKF